MDGATEDRGEPLCWRVEGVSTKLRKDERGVRGERKEILLEEERRRRGRGEEDARGGEDGGQIE